MSNWIEIGLLPVGSSTRQVTPALWPRRVTLSEPSSYEKILTAPSAYPTARRPPSRAHKRTASDFSPALVQYNIQWNRKLPSFTKFKIINFYFTCTWRCDDKTEPNMTNLYKRWVSLLFWDPTGRRLHKHLRQHSDASLIWFEQKLRGHQHCTQPQMKDQPQNEDTGLLHPLSLVKVNAPHLSITFHSK